MSKDKAKKQPDQTENIEEQAMSEEELEKVSGGIIAILIGLVKDPKPGTIQAGDGSVMPTDQKLGR